jgi:dGTPase
MDNLNWDTLLSTKTLREEEPENEYFKRFPLNSFENDYSKIVSCAPFRRLQDKTQVFPLDKSDFVRTRLTHSVEVSSVARELGIKFVRGKQDFGKYNINDTMMHGIPSVLLCAGLLHDLGNPPFGHFGEVVIGEWFKEKLKTIDYKGAKLQATLEKSKNGKRMISDLENFEGNAQALRILSKAEFYSDLNISYSIISTLVKYPTDSLSFDKESTDKRKKKPGYFYAEDEMFNKVAENVGTKLNTGKITRHPLAYILEAADDIAYATADLEDAVKKGLVSLKQFTELFEDTLGAEQKSENGNTSYPRELLNELKGALKKGREDKLPDSEIIKPWIITARRWLIYVAIYGFSSKYNRIMSGDFQNELLHNTYHTKTINVLKGAMSEYVYKNSGILKLELASQTILSFLLDKFVPAVLYYDTDIKQSSANSKLFNLLPKNYVDDYNYNAKKYTDGDADVCRLYLRLLMVTDFISGMTDTYARTLYRELSGME